MPASAVEISGTFTANTNTAYKVEYYYQADDGTYGDTTEKIDNRT